MANRYTDSEKWKDPWFCGLTPTEKLFWFYLLDNCDHCGIWKVNWPLVEFYVGTKDIQVERFNGRIKVIDEGRWFIEKFVLFQQKISNINELNPENRCHKSIINTLTKLNLLSSLVGASKPLARVYGNSNSNVIGGLLLEGGGRKLPTLAEVKEYCAEIKSSIDAEMFFDSYESSGWVKANGQPIKNWKATLRTWERRNKGEWEGQDRL